MTRTLRRTQRGTSLIEAMIAMAVLLVGMAGFASLQVISVRANHFAKRISVASALAVDLTENVNRWGYTDTRLTPYSTITSCTTANMQLCFDDTTVVTRWEMGSAPAPLYTAQYSDANFGATWQGVPVVTGGTPTTVGADPDRDGVPEFTRFYNVYEIDPAGSGIPAGKLVQVVVRWREPAFGFRQVTNTAFKFNPAVVLQ
jgi:Tfp pilus assembly protein PilV